MIKDLNDLPLMMDSSDLVSMGLYPSNDAVYFARKRGTAPNYIKIGRKVFFHREVVLEWLKSNEKNCAENASYIPNITKNPDDCHCEKTCKTEKEHIYRMTGKGNYWKNKIDKELKKLRDA